MEEFNLENRDFIPLCDLLKRVGVCNSGGMAKSLIAEGLVSVDGTVELRKRCKIRPSQIIQYEDKLRDYAQKELNSIDGFRIIGNSENKIGIFSFTIENFHYYDLGLLLDAKGIAVRTGHHCTQPLMDKYNLDGTARVSLALYNTEEEVDFFVDSVKNLLTR